jgi:hypothetical protein
MSSMRRHVHLFEMLRLQAMLLETRLDFLQKTFLPRIALAWQARTLAVPAALAAQLGLPPGEGLSSRARQAASGEHFALTLFNHVVGLDPDSSKKHVQWLLNLILRKTNPMPLEDLDYATESLSRFMAMKQARALPANKTDINGYASLSDLNLALRGEQQHASSALASREQAILAQCQVIYDAADYRVLSLLTQDAACYYGCDTEWCTAWGAPACRHPTRSNMFSDYIRRGPLYYVLEKSSGQKWQFSFAAEQFMDVDDRSVNLPRWLAAHPKINQVFQAMDGEPVADLNGGAVYAQGRGFIVKSAPGPAGKIMLTAVVDDQGVLQTLSGRWAVGRNSATSEPYLNDLAVSFADRLAQLLTRLQITGDPKGEAVCGELFYRRGRWGSLRAVATTVLRVGDITWKQVKTPTYRDLLLVVAERVEYLNATLSADGVFSVIEVASDKIYDKTAAASRSYADKRRNRHPLLASVSHALTSFLLIDPQPQTWDTDALVKAADLTPADAERLITAKPGLGDLATAFRVHGATPTIKAMVVDWCEAADAAMTGEWQGDNLVIERFANVGAMVEELGDDGAKWFNKTLSGDHHLDYYDVTADRHRRADFIRNLPADIRLALGTHLQASYPDAVAEIDAYDPADADAVIELAEAVEDDELQQAANWASQDGCERGAENEMSEMFWKEIKSHDNIVFVDTNGQPADPAHDTACWFVIPLDDLIDFIARHGSEDAATNISQDGFAGAFEIKIQLSEPHSGFMDYDEDAAQERFNELVYEFLPAQSESATQD